MKKIALALATVLLLVGCGPKPNTDVENFDLGNGIKYTGHINENAKPDGENSKLVYKNGDVFVGLIEDGVVKSGTLTYAADNSKFVGELNCGENYALTKADGKLTYENGQYYEGKFVNDLFEDTEGIFNYTLRVGNEVSPDVIYKGNFKAGTYVGQVGGLTYPAKESNAEGIWKIYDVEMSAEKTIKPNQNCKYMEYFASENRSFDGDGYYDGTTATYVADVTYNGVTNFYNGCTYTGEYKNGLYHGKGKFVWDLFDGYSYIEGDFANGTPVGLVCIKYFPCAFNGDLGCHCFRGVMGTFESPAANQLGWGKIKYDDNSMYIGDIWFNGDFGGGWIRSGQGTIDGTDGWIYGNWVENVGETLASIIGSKLIDYIDATFDRDLNFMKGNGIFYFRKSDGTPYGYLAGKWEGWKYVGAYEGELPEIREGYTNDLSQYLD